ncbi:MAG: hypothetical protein M9908_14680 [Phyllobacteriaceae bacterium]|nr:hypothetical protein [Phyllobacteriaceae bacterium]
MHLRIGDSAADRLKRAKKLAALRPNHPEGSLAIAESAIDAKEWKLARETMKGVLSTRPTERACLLMADIEEGEFGDKGRMRDWLSRAVRAPKDAVWTADGYVSEKWLPVSPLTGRIDAFEWKVPVEQLGAPQAMASDAGGLEDLIGEPPAAQPAAAEETDPVPAPKAAPETGTAPAGADAAGPLEEAEDTALIEAEEPANSTGEKEVAASAEDVAAAGTEDALIAADTEDTDAAGEKAEAAGREGEEEEDKTVVFPFGRRPDDPGVSEDDPPPERKKRFGLF